MKRSATLSVFASIALIAGPALMMPVGCTRSSESDETVEMASPQEQASDRPAVAPPVTAAPDRAPRLDAEAATPDERGAAEPNVLMPTAPRGAAATADPIETPRSGFAAPREPWREQLVGVTKPLPKELTEEIIDRCIEVARDIDSALGDRLALLREKNPAQLIATLRRTERLYALALLKQRDTSLYDLKLLELNVDREISRLTKEYREAVLRERDPGNIEQQLRMQIRLQLAFQFRNRENHLCELRELIEKLEIEFDTEKAYLEEHADEVVEERIRKIIDAIEPPPPE